MVCGISLSWQLEHELSHSHRVSRQIRRENTSATHRLTTTWRTGTTAPSPRRCQRSLCWPAICMCTRVSCCDDELPGFVRRQTAVQHAARRAYMELSSVSLTCAVVALMYRATKAAGGRSNQTQSSSTAGGAVQLVGAQPRSQREACAAGQAAGSLLESRDQRHPYDERRARTEPVQSFETQLAWSDHLCSITNNSGQQPPPTARTSPTWRGNDRKKAQKAVTRTRPPARWSVPGPFGPRRFVLPLDTSIATAIHSSNVSSVHLLRKRAAIR